MTEFELKAIMVSVIVMKDQKFILMAYGPLMCGSPGACPVHQRWNRVFGSRVTGSPGQRFWSGRVGSRVSASYPVFDPVLSFNMRDCAFNIVALFLQSNTISAN